MAKNGPERHLNYWAELIVAGLKIRSVAERDALRIYLAKDLLPKLVKEIAGAIREQNAKKKQS